MMQIIYLYVTCYNVFPLSIGRNYINTKEFLSVSRHPLKVIHQTKQNKKKLSILTLPTTTLGKSKKSRLIVKQKLHGTGR